MSQPAKSCGCAGKRCGNPCKPVLQAKKATNCGSRGTGCGGGNEGGRRDQSGSNSCGSPGGCGCLGPFPQKSAAKPSK